MVGRLPKELGFIVAHSFQWLIAGFRVEDGNSLMKTAASQSVTGCLGQVISFEPPYYEF